MASTAGGAGGPSGAAARFGGLELAAGAGALDEEEGEAEGAGGAVDGEGDGVSIGGDGGGGARRRSLEELLGESRWLVPKRRHSHSRKRHRQSNPLYQEAPLAHMYPCPKCAKGLMKLRHHLCPCDQDAVGANGVVRVAYGSPPPPAAPAAPPAATGS